MLERARAEVAAARGDVAGAIAATRTALERWTDIGSLVYAAATRLRLAQLLEAAGDSEGAELELCAAENVLRRHEVGMLLGSCDALRASIDRSGAGGLRA